MGIPLTNGAAGTPGAGDQANFVVSGSFSAIGTSGAFAIYGAFNIAIYGNGGPNGAWNGSVQLERTFDGGTTWIVCGVGGSGQQAVWTTTTGADVSISGNEVERAVGYRLHCTAWTSGTINYRMSGTGVLGTTNGIPS